MWFWIDLASVLPIQLIFETGNLRIFLRASKLPKLYKITKISKLMRTARAGRKYDSIWTKFHNMIKLNSGIDRLITNLFTVFIFCHIFACFWHFVARISDGINNWIIATGLQDTDIYTRYITSMYWIIQTVITVGYGDIPISNSFEQLIAIFAMFAGVLFFSITVGSLTTIISEMDLRGASYENKLNLLIEIKKNYKITERTFEKIRRTIKYTVYKSDENYLTFLNSLSECIRIELGYYIYRGLVSGIHFFDSKDKQFISTMAPHLKQVSHSRGEIIFNEGEGASEMYFIKEGNVSFVIPECEFKSFMDIGQGNYFGEIDMIFVQNRKFMAIASTDVELLALDSERYRDLITRKSNSISDQIREIAITRRLKQISLFVSAKEEYEEEQKQIKLNAKRYGFRATSTIERLKTPEILPVFSLITYRVF